jgi:type VI secretion system protein ImpH
MAPEKRQSADTVVEYAPEQEAPRVSVESRFFARPRYAEREKTHFREQDSASKRFAESEARLAHLVALAPQSDFFALVGRLEYATKNAVRVGGVGPVSREAIRFRHDPSMAFSTGDVSAARIVEKYDVPDDISSPKRSTAEIVTTFLGLTGSASPLPLYLASEIAQLDTEESVSRAFLDIFHHRIISLFYRLWIRYQYPWESRADPTDRWSRRVLSFAGIDHYDRAPVRQVPVWKSLRVVALLAGRARPAYILPIVIKEYLREILDGAEVGITQFVGGWTSIAKDQLMQLGRSNCFVGINALIGSRIYDQSDRFTIRIGPVGAKGYRRFTANREWLSAVREAVELAVRVPLAYEIELLLSPDAQLGCRLSARSPASLGSDTRLSGKRAFRSIRIPVDERPALSNDSMY